MWKCDKCETVNTNNFCVVCGSKMPEPRQRGNQSQSSNYQSGGNYAHRQRALEYEEAYNMGKGLKGSIISPTDEKKKSKKGMIIGLCVAVFVVIAVAGTVAAIHFINEGAVSPVSYETETEEIDTERSDIDEEENLDMPEVVPSTAVKYDIYRNDDYGFYCAYPADFVTVEANDINALQQYESKDSSAIMTIRAAENTAEISIEDALNDFYSAFRGEVSYEASGETWYAISIKMDDNRALYRKFFIKNGNIYCMDFEMNEDEVDKYGPYIEYIEDNFRAD